MHLRTFALRAFWTRFSVFRRIVFLVAQYGVELFNELLKPRLVRFHSDLRAQLKQAITICLIHGKGQYYSIGRLGYVRCRTVS
jgi:hypothetical protein